MRQRPDSRALCKVLGKVLAKAFSTSGRVLAGCRVGQLVGKSMENLVR